MTQSSTPPIIAIIGCDGSGKTTVCLELERWLNSVHPTKLCHLGRQTGNIRRRLIKLPFLGKNLIKILPRPINRLNQKKDRTHYWHWEYS